MHLPLRPPGGASTQQIGCHEQGASVTGRPSVSIDIQCEVFVFSEQRLWNCDFPTGRASSRNPSVKPRPGNAYAWEWDCPIHRIHIPELSLEKSLYPQAKWWQAWPRV